MAEMSTERRRCPRVPLSGGEQVGLPLAVSVQLVDISAGGVLLSSSQDLPVGQRAKLRATLGVGPVNLDVEIRRVMDHGLRGASRGRFRVGVAFASLDAAASQSVQHFLSGDAQ